MEQTVLKPKNLSSELEKLRLAAICLDSIPGRPPKLPIINIGPRDLTFEAHSMQDLEALADIE